MDQSYNSKDAAEALNKMRTICLGNEIRPHISCFLEREGWEDSVEIRKFEEPSCWRMTQSDANGIFEVILHMQGVLEDKRLPPIRGELGFAYQYRPAQRKGSNTYDNPSPFAKDVDCVYDMYALFSRHVPGLKIMATKGTAERPMLEMSNRIFTPKVEAPNMNPATVNPEMDENGFIERINATNGMFVYGEENIVVYGEERIDATGRKKTVRIPPQRLHVGDIVDVAFSMVAFGRGSELKARLLLRNITLLDATHTQKWLKEKVKAQSLNIRVQPTLKRRLEFEDDEDDTRKRMKGMDIENDKNEIEDSEEDARMRMKGMDIENDENGNEREGTCITFEAKKVAKK
ncbi:hypothetical protein C8J55DRAFT_488523 [Lentinula edodes]|uniref:Uncharacterized protein n=1 Tax=Lentinula lateritia TaxID=40482 RepID=A0A9W9AJA8_9AGAR|nr:hypothetical protein C8J55DRAFT_488523 [Lentinula edodes]